MHPCPVVTEYAQPHKWAHSMRRSNIVDLVDYLGMSINERINLKAGMRMFGEVFEYEQLVCPDDPQSDPDWVGYNELEYGDVRFYLDAYVSGLTYEKLCGMEIEEIMFGY